MNEKRGNRLVVPLGIALLAAALYLPGMRWGLPANVSWSQDTIAGNRTLGAVAGWPQAWLGRYPPLHYLILNAAYQPVLQHWERTGERITNPDTGKTELKPPHAPKMGLLILIARIVSVAMAIGAALGLWFAAQVLVRDELAATISAVVLLIGAAFTYFAHLGNVDVPSMCWFTWSVYFYARLLRSHAWKDAALLGLFGSLAISTKDAMAGVYPGMAVVLVVIEMRQRMQGTSAGRALAQTVWQFKWVVGLAAFAIPYMLLYNVLADPHAYLERMKYWLDPAVDTLHARQHRYDSQLHLLGATVYYAAGAVGWPMLVAMAGSIVYTLRCHTKNALVLLVPAVTYYVLVIAQIDFVYSRFLFPPLALLAILVGIAGAAMLRAERLPVQVRFVLPALVLGLSLGYAIAVDLEMITDSRYQAEAWLEDNVAPPSSVGVFSDAQYLPRAHELGYATYRVEMTREAFAKPQPDYLILTSYNYEDFNNIQKECMTDLVTGKLGYKLVVTFRGSRLGTGSSWLSIAGWGALPPGKISPTITILRRNTP